MTKAPVPKINPAVRGVLAAIAPPVRERLIELRGLIYAAAHDALGQGGLVETLKWNDPAYLPAAARTGTTVRMNAVKGTDQTFALYFHCQTTLLADFRHIYPKTFRTEGDRAILFGVKDRLPQDALRHCIALALTYHARGRAAPSPDPRSRTPTSRRE